MFAKLRSSSRTPALWVLLAMIVFEFVVFDQWGAHQHTKIYPRWNDQIQYLTEAYRGYEEARAHGLLGGVTETLTNPSAQGTLQDFYALWVFELASPSRSAALAINVLALILWQVALFGVFRRAASPWIALLASLLPLALAGPWRPEAGSAYDFRLDHLTMCTMGISLCFALRTDSFRHRAWSIMFGVAVGVTLLTRFLTGTYFVVILFGLLLWTGLGAERRRRLGNVLLAAGCAAALAAPVFWRNREWIWNYYWIGHYVGPESAIRNQHFGLGQSLEFIGTHFYADHLGLGFVALAATVTVCLAALSHRRTASSGLGAPAIISLLFTLAPLLILTLHAQKSAVVLGVLAPGLIGVIALGWAFLAGNPRHGAIRPALALVALLVTIALFLQRQRQPVYDPLTQAQLRHVTTLGPEIAARSAAAGINVPRVAVDYITDALDAQVLRVTTYERTHRMIPFEMTLPTSIAEPTEADVWDRLKKSDFVFLSEMVPSNYYPFEQKLATLRPALHAWCHEHLREVEHFTFLGRSIVLFQRRDIPLSSVSP